MNYLEEYSPPLSFCKILIIFSNWLSTKALNSMNFTKHSPIYFMKYQIHFKTCHHELTKYFVPPTRVVLVSPQTSKWINSNTFEAFNALSLGKGSQCCFLNTHLSQNGNFFPSIINDKPSTRLCCASNFTFPTLRCLSHSCHKWWLNFLYNQ